MHSMHCSILLSALLCGLAWSGLLNCAHLLPAGNILVQKGQCWLSKPSWLLEASIGCYSVCVLACILCPLISSASNLHTSWRLPLL